MTNCVKRLLPLALAAALAGCTMQATDSNATRYQVALVAKSKDSEFWNAVFTGAEAAATEYNMQLTIAAPNSEEDYEEQDRMIEKAVEDGAQAIVFSAIDYEKNAAAIDAAAAAGVTIIGIDSAVNSDNVAAYIGADNYGAGQMAAQSALDGMDGQLYVGLINYEVNGANGRDREQGARDAFADSGRAEVVAAMPTHSNAVSARSEALSMLREHPEINVLVAFNEATAVGAARAVQQMQRADDLWLVAFDSNIETIDAFGKAGARTDAGRPPDCAGRGAAGRKVPLRSGRGRADRAEYLRHGLFRRRKRLQAAGRAGEQRGRIHRHHHPHHHPGQCVRHG